MFLIDHPDLPLPSWGLTPASFPVNDLSRFPFMSTSQCHNLLIPGKPIVPIPGPKLRAELIRRPQVPPCLRQWAGEEGGAGPCPCLRAVHSLAGTQTAAAQTVTCVGPALADSSQRTDRPHLLPSMGCSEPWGAGRWHQGGLCSGSVPTAPAPTCRGAVGEQLSLYLSEPHVSVLFGFQDSLGFQ